MVIHGAHLFGFSLDLFHNYRFAGLFQTFLDFRSMNENAEKNKKPENATLSIIASKCFLFALCSINLSFFSSSVVRALCICKCMCTLSARIRRAICNQHVKYFTHVQCGMCQMPSICKIILSASIQFNSFADNLNR